MRHFLYTLVLAAAGFSTLGADQPFSLPMEAPSNHIDVNNAVLAKVNGKPITLLDVVKKMDLFFYRQFAEYAAIPAARYEFYQASWPRFLQDIIEKELVLAAAEEAKLPVTTGDIRQEMEALFGPNTTVKLGEMGLSHTEAWNMIKGDILLRRMLYGKVHLKAAQAVTPQVVRQAYERYAAENRHPERWRYRVFSFRGASAEGSLAAAEVAHCCLTEENVPADKLVDAIARHLPDTTVTVNVSEEFCLPPTEISELYRDVLDPLAANSYSPPIMQQSRAAGTTLYRIFYLKEKESEGSDPFSKVEPVLKAELLEAAVEKETTIYLEWLKGHFSVQRYCDPETMPPGYRPFVLR